MSPLARSIIEYLDRMLARRRRKVGTVSGTNGTKVIVVVDGNTVTLPRLSSYTPVNGDVVHIDCNGDSWLVLGKSA
jgi:hypothetical protein